MNFTGEIKRELLRNFPEKHCCRCALFAAALDTSGKWKKDGSAGFSFTSESERNAEYFLRLSERLGLHLLLTQATRDPKHGRDRLTFSGGAEDGELLRKIAARRAKGCRAACCMQAYLKGAFLFGGSCTLPHEGTKTGYHLEVVFGDKKCAGDFLALLERSQLLGNIVKRGESQVVYMKSRESIGDFLSVVGAQSALRTLDGISAAREESNNENRIGNCSAGNTDRALTASANQTRALNAMKEAGYFAGLPAPLLEVAEGRLANPVESLTELGRTLGLSKSCLNHRMRKLMQLYNEYLQKGML